MENIRNDYFEWTIIEGKTESNRLEKDVEIPLRFFDMLPPIQVSDNEYTTEINLKFYYGFSNGFILLDTTLKAKVNSTKRAPLFKKESTEDDIKALTFLLDNILLDLDLAIENLPDLKGRKKPSQMHPSNEIVYHLLESLKEKLKNQ